VPIQRARVTEEKVSGLVAELFAFYGPEQQQPSLFDPSGDDAAETDRVPVLTALPEGTRLALLAYASNDRAGVLNAWLGEGELACGDTCTGCLAGTSSCRSGGPPRAVARAVATARQAHSAHFPGRGLPTRPARLPRLRLGPASTTALCRRSR